MLEKEKELFLSRIPARAEKGLPHLTGEEAAQPKWSIPALGTAHPPVPAHPLAAAGGAGKAPEPRGVAGQGGGKAGSAPCPGAAAGGPGRGAAGP